MTTLSLTKHHGLGNDFLVLLDPDAATTVTAPMARALCERRTGVGADGLLHVVKAGDGADLELSVWNADGSVAETSGNGLRCMAQAAFDAGLVPAELIVTNAGARRRLSIGPETSPGLREISAGMGKVEVGPEEPKWVTPQFPKASWARLLNPHLVLLANDPLTVDVDRIGDSINRSADGPVNVEFIAKDAPDRLRLRVFERGVGETQACGTGSVAAAAVARHWGLTGDEVTVTNPGGDLLVHLTTEGEATLTGPAQFVARIEVTFP